MFLQKAPYSVEIGLEDGKVPDRAFSASSQWDKYHRANRARLNSVATKRYRGGWSTRKNNRRQWLQVKLRRRARITGLATQGRQDLNQWVRSYSISYSLTGRSFRPYKENGRVKVTVSLSVPQLMWPSCEKKPALVNAAFLTDETKLKLSR